MTRAGVLASISKCSIWYVWLLSQQLSDGVKRSFEGRCCQEFSFVINSSSSKRKRIAGVQIAVAIALFSSTIYRPSCFFSKTTYIILEILADSCCLFSSHFIDLLRTVVDSSVLYVCRSWLQFQSRYSTTSLAAPSPSTPRQIEYSLTIARPIQVTIFSQRSPKL